MKPRRFDDRVGFFTVGVPGLRRRPQAPGRGGPVHHPLAAREEGPEGRGLRAEEADRLLHRPRGARRSGGPGSRRGSRRGSPPSRRPGSRTRSSPRTPPPPREDPDWDAEDARYSSIRWLPSTIENAMGPHVHDPRTGEILEADILIYHNVLKLIRDWYFVQASPNDPKAQTLPLPDDLMGECWPTSIAHEVGHTLGFPHNMKAQLVVHRRAAPRPGVHQEERHRGVDHGLRPVQLRRPARRRRAAHPDHRPLRLLRRRVGLQGVPGRDDLRAGEGRAREDRRPPGEGPARSASATRTRRGPLAADRGPRLRPDRAPPSWGSRTSTASPATSSRPPSKKGEDYDLLRNMYDQLLAQRNRELGHVANVVGGFVRNNFWYRRRRRRSYDPSPPSSRRRRCRSSSSTASSTPPALIAPDILDRLEAHGSRRPDPPAQQIAAPEPARASRGSSGWPSWRRRRPRTPTRRPTWSSDLHAGIFGELKARAGRDRPLPPQPPARLCGPARRLPRQPERR